MYMNSGTSVLDGIYLFCKKAVGTAVNDVVC